MKFKSPEDFHQKLSFLFNAIIALPLLIFIYLFLELKNDKLHPVIEDGSQRLILNILMSLAAMIIAILAYYRYRKDLVVVEGEEKLEGKLSVYFNKLLIFYSQVEFVSIILVLGLYLTNFSLFIFGYVLVLFFLSLNRPAPQRYVKDLKLKDEDRDIIIHKSPFAE